MDRKPYNIVLINPFVRYDTPVSRLPKEFTLDNAKLFIVDSEAGQSLDRSVLESDQRLLDDYNSLKALSRTESVIVVPKDIAEFELPDETSNMDTIWVYYGADTSVGVNNSFDVMCITNDFPLMYPTTVRRYIALGANQTTDVNALTLEAIEAIQPIHDFYTSERIPPGMSFDRTLPVELTRALIEWLKSGFDLEVDPTYKPATNVYNQISKPDERVIPGKRPNWVLNAETPSIKGLIYSTGLEYANQAVKYATSFTDGRTTQQFILHSASYRKVLTETTIKVLGNHMLNNDLMSLDEVRLLGGWSSPDTWDRALARLEREVTQ